MSKTSLLKLKIKISVTSSLRVFKNPWYIILAVFSALFMGLFVVWSLNFDLLMYILFSSPLSPLEKLEFMFNGYFDLYANLPGLLPAGILTLTTLFGINTAIFVYVIKKQGFKKFPKKSGLGAFLFAFLGSGCIACGTSILAPLLVTLGATTTPFIHNLGAIFNWIGSALLVYSIYKLGGICSTIFATKQQNNNSKNS